jgi:ribosomal protein L37E
MALSESTFTALVDAGCTKCGATVLRIEALVAQKVPLYCGEVYGTPSWGYKGEELVAGTYSIACKACGEELYRATECALCGAADGVLRALETENAFALPAACNCGSERLTALAMVPAAVQYEGKRANKARAQATPEEPGFHAVRVSCNSCPRVYVASESSCALCGHVTA